ncbi:Fimbria adhesin protein [Klebsiella spallanzanii]|uniref:Fimbria adhesin protein n=1 Tax=Klebsiella spallanzanii TaxID=2587528 RepID=A0ABY6VPM3_9ENTR|nr:fimbrial protein [Klebsiella spallanzanii]VUS85321.1 Fimbria adhesin protein [Klebsiella spallanzanii]
MKQIMRMAERSGRRMKGGLSLLAALAGLLAAQVQAVTPTCELAPIFTETVSIPVVGPGLSTAGEDAPVGTVLYKGQYSGMSNKTTKYSCGGGENEVTDVDFIMTILTKAEVVTTPSGAAITSGGKDIFPTNVEGIGAIFYFSAYTATQWSQFPASRSVSTSVTAGSLGIVGLSNAIFNGVTVELVKTGPIASGTHQVLGSSFPVFQFSVDATGPDSFSNVFFIVNFTGATTMYTKTCQLASSNIDVYLGRHDISSFDGAGATSDWQDFDITLKDCPPFYGYGNYRLSASTGNLTDSSSANSVALSFNSVNGVVDGNPAIASLDSSDDAATGVGIELSRRDVSGNIPLDGTGGFELDNLTTDDNATYVIPLKARYVQTESNVTAGIANGAVVFTIVYQ